MKAKPTFITRFAPSPNGWLHLGHAYSALIGYALAQAQGGQFLLRMEDIDTGRSRPHFIDGIEQDLAWLGIEWPQPMMLQSQRFPLYEQALARLQALGVLYPCWATRRDISKAIEAAPGGVKSWPRDPDGALVYPGLYRDIPEPQRRDLMWQGGAYAWRLDMHKACELAEAKNAGPIFYTEMASGQAVETQIDARAYGDVIVARRDVPTSYHLSVIVDDAAQAITQVTRGQDLQPATAIHRVLQVLLDFPTPSYFHHRLIRDVSGRRLSKQAGDLGFRDLRQQGMSPKQVIDLLPPIDVE
ncbi:tRNA glutamyl-Q(34) synthetase GluQRS [Alphaproteobacteria bacterium]|nr:tRNA glutamyl-Q(34) synthetase GluQRS [Alphaproteobacteria bacterium]